MEGKKVFTRKNTVYNSCIRKEEKDFILFFKEEGLKFNEFTIPSQKLERNNRINPNKGEKQKNKINTETEQKVKFHVTIQKDKICLNRQIYQET